jgi:hypothetical protein
MRYDLRLVWHTGVCMHICRGCIDLHSGRTVGAIENNVHIRRNEGFPANRSNLRYSRLLQVLLESVVLYRGLLLCRVASYTYVRTDRDRACMQGPVVARCR